MLAKPILAIAFSLLLGVAGCASTSGNDRATAAEVGAVHPRAVSIFRGQGAAASWSDLVLAASSADAVLIGENHSHPLGLASAAALWEDVLASAPSAALAMEFFERDQQIGLDDFVGGLTDEAAFRKATARGDGEGSYPAGHRAMVQAAKAKGRPVIAANAPRRYVRLARADGYDRLASLTPEQRRLFRIPDELPTGGYRDAFDRVMTGGGVSHAGESPAEPAPRSAEEQRRLDAVFRSQSLWDWTMADSVSRSLAAGARPTMLVIGRFHIDHVGGTLLALRKLSPSARIITVSFIDAWSTSLAADDRDRADFVVYVGPSEPASP